MATAMMMGTNAITGYDLQWKSTPSYVDEDDSTLDTSDWPDDEATDSHGQVIGSGRRTDASAGKYSVLHMQILTTQPLPTPLIPGATFYYRVRAVSPMQETGTGRTKNP